MTWFLWRSSWYLTAGETLDLSSVVLEKKFKTPAGKGNPKEKYLNCEAYFMAEKARMGRGG